MNDKQTLESEISKLRKDIEERDVILRLVDKLALSKSSNLEAENAELILMLDNFLAEGRPHGGRNTQFPDGCECDLCQNWDNLNKQRDDLSKANSLTKGTK